MACAVLEWMVRVAAAYGGRGRLEVVDGMGGVAEGMRRARPDAREIDDIDACKYRNYYVDVVKTTKHVVGGKGNSANGI